MVQQRPIFGKMDDPLQIELPGYDLRIDKADRHNNGMRILRKVRELCKWFQDSFPGSQPISLTRLNMENLGRNRYVACEKTDGVRYLLFAASDKVFLIDRLETVRCLDMHLPCRFTPQKKHHLTLLDGELVTDTIPSTEPGSPPKKVARYLVYDGVKINGQSIMELNLLDRLAKIFSDVIKPRLQYMESQAEAIERERNGNQYLDIYLKDFFEIWDIGAISRFSSRLPHPSDGIIFTSVFLPYTPGTCVGLLKWKPPHLNTVDFFADIITDSRSMGPDGQSRSRKPQAVRLLVGRRGFKVFNGKWLSLQGEKCKELLQRFEEGNDAVNMTIWECYYDFEAITYVPSIVYESDHTECFDFNNMQQQTGGWCVERIRTDKTMPNDERVVDRVFESISDGVSFAELQTTFQQYQTNGKPPVASLCALPEYYNQHGSTAFVDAKRKPSSVGEAAACK